MKKYILKENSVFLYKKKNQIYKDLVFIKKFLSPIKFGIKMKKLNKFLNNYLKIYLINEYLFFSPLLLKFCCINQRRGKKYLSRKFLTKALYFSKKFYNIENKLIFEYVINLFKLPIQIQKKKKGRKVLLLPKFFDLEKVSSNVILNLSSVLKEKRGLKKSFLYNIILEFFFILKQDYVNSALSKFYNSLLKTFIDNRSWVILK